MTPPGQVHVPSRDTTKGDSGTEWRVVSVKLPEGVESMSADLSDDLH